MYYPGIDRRKRYSQVAVMDEKGKILIESNIVRDLIQLLLHQPTDCLKLPITV